MDRHGISATRLSADIKADGAELCSLRRPDGAELLWQAEPIWPRHAPVLFPIVGRLKDDRLHHLGRSYTMGQHGFARNRRFAWVETTPTSCRLMLEDDAQTRAAYPFAFRFEIAFSVDADTLSVTYCVTNTGNVLLPASMGAHPAFAWPLTPGVAKTEYRLDFAAAEPEPIRRLSHGLLLADPQPSPIEDKTLMLREELFAPDAIILDRPASHSVRYGAAEGPSVEVSWTGFVELGIWSRPPADFVCIEPWHGTASPEDFQGEFTEKPGLMLLEPGEQRRAAYRIRVG